MKFEAAGIEGVWRIEIERHVDERGFFARLFCPEEFASAGIDFHAVQTNLSRNSRKHTLRGMHWQDAPYGEAKLVRCTRGAIWDVVADIRRQSPTYRKWIAVELSAERANALFVPEGCAHGFLTLEDNCDVQYEMSRKHVPGQGKGFRFDDPAFSIAWPHEPAVVGATDRAWPCFGG